MKKIFIYIFLIGIIFSCKDNDDTKAYDADLLGKWKLTETLSDPGDGSGTYKTVISEKIIHFHKDGTLSSNGSICDLSILSDTPSSGTYSYTKLTISAPDCYESVLGFKLIGSTLIIYYPCIEGCSAKFVKIES